MKAPEHKNTTQHPLIPLDPEKIDAVIFDLDGVITDTRCAHEASWKRLFDDYLEEHEASHQSAHAPFSHEDYSKYLDGKPRYDGVQDFLASRDIHLPLGKPGDSTDLQTVCGLGNRKNRYFSEWLNNHRVDTFPDTVELLQGLARIGIVAAVISASENCESVLANAGIREQFAVKVDGKDMAELGLPGKPDPAIFLQAAQQLGVSPERAVVIEDALAGVQAAAGGDFALVVGINREGAAHRQGLLEYGAHVVTDTLAVLLEIADKRESYTPAHELPWVWDATHRISEHLRGRHVALFLDYDGTLTPIVEDYRKARLSVEASDIIGELTRFCTVAVVSGRDLDDVRNLVGVDNVFYAGSHGFDIAGPDGSHEEIHQGTKFLPDLESAELCLRDELGDIRGASVERKKFSIAIHYRQVADDEVPAVKQIVDRVLSDHSRLRGSSGKKVFDVKPRTDWNKGRALQWLLERYGFEGADVFPIYIGDDTTDEDAFRVLRERDGDVGGGIGILVRDDRGGQTLANYALKDSNDVLEFLKWLATSQG